MPEVVHSTQKSSFWGIIPSREGKLHLDTKYTETKKGSFFSPGQKMVIRYHSLLEHSGSIIRSFGRKTGPSDGIMVLLFRPIPLCKSPYLIYTRERGGGRIRGVIYTAPDALVRPNSEDSERKSASSWKAC